METINYLSFLTEGSLLGLATGLSCAVFCIPVLIGLSSRTINRITPALNIIFFLAGRFIAYILVGLIFSLIGMQLKTLGSFQMISRFIMGGLLVYWGVKGVIESDKESAACQIKSHLKLMPFFAGILTGLSPCPPFIAGITRVIGAGDVAAGTIYFFGFYLSTSIFLLPGFMTGLVKYKSELKQLISFISIIFGAMFLLMGVYKLLFVFSS